MRQPWLYSVVCPFGGLERGNMAVTHTHTQSLSPFLKEIRGGRVRGLNIGAVAVAGTN